MSIATEPSKQVGRFRQREAYQYPSSSTSLSYVATTLYPGWNLVTVSDSNIAPASWVYASVTEVSGLPFVGAAHFVVGNVVPENGQVQVYVNSDWGSPLNVWVNVLTAL